MLVSCISPHMWAPITGIHIGWDLMTFWQSNKWVPCCFGIFSGLGTRLFAKRLDWLSLTKGNYFSSRVEGYIHDLKIAESTNEIHSSLWRQHCSIVWSSLSLLKILQRHRWRSQAMSTSQSGPGTESLFRWHNIIRDRWIHMLTCQRTLTK